MQIIALVVHFAAYVLFYMLWARFILDVVRQVRRDWKPRGFWLAVSVAILAVTDPPLRLVRRFVKPLRVGGAAIDLSMLILMALVLVVIVIAGAFA